MNTRLLLSDPTSPWPLTTTPTTPTPPTSASGTAVDDSFAVVATDLVVSGVRLAEIAESYGTPIYVIDEADVRARCRAYRAALPEAEIAYAGKAFLSRAMINWVEQEGLSLDVCSGGELALARHAGFPADRIVLHGNAKTPREVHRALACGVGRIVVDSFYEITQLAVAADPAHPQKILIRVTPGVDAHTHQAVATGIEDQKFGFSLANGAAANAVRQIMHWQRADRPPLRLVGLHCHLGSQISTLDAFVIAVRKMVALMAWIRDQFDVVLPEINLGGGHAVPYCDGDPGFDLAEFARIVPETLREACRSYELPVPRLTVEPGRAIVARAGPATVRSAAWRPAGGAVHRCLSALDGLHVQPGGATSGDSGMRRRRPGPDPARDRRRPPVTRRRRLGRVRGH
jgi:diaminopimelate decarboxylase